VRFRLVPSVLCALAAALLVAGCGSSDEGGSEAAALAPPSAPLFADVLIQPEGEAKQNVDALAQTIAGVDNLGELVVEELESSAAEEGEEVDFEKEIQPWLGEKAGMFAGEYANGEDFNGYGIAIAVTDEGEAKAFVDKQSEAEDEAPKDGSYEGFDFKVAADDGQTVGVVDGFLVLAEDEAIFKEMVDAAEGESLADSDSYSAAVSDVPGDSAADVYLDIGRMIDEAGNKIDSETQLFLDSVGIEPEEATAVASVVPSAANQIEVDLSTDLSGENPPSGDASELLGTLPGGAVAAIASAEFGKRFEEGIDQIDEEGIPGQVPPHQLKKALKQAGIDLEQIFSSIGNVAVFAEGNSERNLGGALVLETESETEAKNTVANVGLFLRKTGMSGITAINGKASGFSVRSPDLGRQPLVVAASGKRIAIGYGLPAAMAVLEDKGSSLADAPSYKEALSALGSTPISAYVDGPSALTLASSMISPSDEGFREAKPYLNKVEYVALGSEASGDLATAKMIIGVGK
jgi:uncharacterized protein DUF3352